MADTFPDDDPPPLPPVRPGNDECCGGGCVPCVFDLYEQALERYRDDLAAWRRRNASDRSAEAKVVPPADATVVLQ